MEALLESMLFLGLSGDDVVNPDAALAVLERIIYLLRRMTPEDRSMLVQQARELALREQQSGLYDSSARVEFLLLLEENIDPEDSDH
jgi:hypothetical protein